MNLALFLDPYFGPGAGKTLRLGFDHGVEIVLPYSLLLQVAAYCRDTLVRQPLVQKVEVGHAYVAAMRNASSRSMQRIACILRPNAVHLMGSP